MNHNATVLANEIARLSGLILLHRSAAKSGLPFTYGEHTYKGDAAWHNKCANTLERLSNNLAQQLANHKETELLESL